MKSGVETIDAEQICIERVGEKAFGLASLPAKWTLPFFVISDELFDDYTKAGTANDLMTAWGYAISLAAAQCKIELDDQIIVRSNAHSEGLENRGKFISVEGTLREWPQLVKRCFDDFIAQEGSSNVRMPVIIQKRVISLFCGHISNERRVAKDLRDWRGEFDVVAPPRTFRISLRNWRKKVNTTDQFNSKLMCPSDRNIRTALTIPCTWVTSQKIRVHFEWVYDGDYLYLVQADEEKSSSGIDPTKLSCKSEEGNKSTDRNFPHCLRMLRAEDTERYKQYAKIQNPLLYRRLDFSVQKFTNYKKYFVFPMDDGKWEVQCLKPPYDWYEAISDEKWVKQIAYVTRLISEEEQNSVSVMWFVGVDKSQYNCDVFPWYHEHYEYNDNLSMPRNKLSFEDAIAIHTLQDLKNLEALTQTSASNIRNIQIQPTNANFLRDRDVIGRIGTVAKGLGASILLEGGILSHAYYQLIRTGAKVQVRYSFEKRQQFEFNKLVRDKIPEKIEKNGEEAVTAELNKELFSSLLKRKLVEEALEVLDSKNDEDIIAELADILEVLDGILSQYQIDFNTVLSQKEIKRKKSGGFDKGIYLKKTTSRTASGEGRIIVDKAPVDTKQGISKSTDWRRYPNANESLTRIKVPVTLDKWEVRPSVKSDNIDIVLRGERKQGVWQVEISVFEEADQLSFFDK